MKLKDSKATFWTICMPTNQFVYGRLRHFKKVYIPLKLEQEDIENIT